MLGDGDNYIMRCL